MSAHDAAVVSVCTIARIEGLVGWMGGWVVDACLLVLLLSTVGVFLEFSRAL